MIYSLQNERFRLSASDMGAKLTSFQEVRTAQPYEYIWQDRNVWNGQSPLLFPIVGRLRDDTYVLNGRSYTLRKHGFAKRMRFALETQTEDSFTLLLTDDDATREAFPFAFELRATYTLLADGFRMEFRVTNRSDETMYFSIGAHPGFQCEMGDRLILDEPETADAFRLDANALRAEKTIPVFRESREIEILPDTFAHDALIFSGLRSRGATLARKNTRGVHVDFGGAPCLGVWAKPGAKYVCIEPWYGIDDRFDAAHDFPYKEQILSLAHPPPSPSPSPRAAWIPTKNRPTRNHHPRHPPGRAREGRSPLELPIKTISAGNRIRFPRGWQWRGSLLPRPHVWNKHHSFEYPLAGRDVL